MAEFVEVADVVSGPVGPLWPARSGTPLLGRTLVIAPRPDASLEAVISAAGFATASATSGADAMVRWPLVRPDVIIIDLGSASGATSATCREIKRRHPVPIVVVSDDADDDIVDILVAGADAFLVKPVGNHELVARMRALLRRQPAATSSSPSDRLEGIRVDRRTRVATLAGTPLDLSPREFDVLSVLVADHGHRVTRREALGRSKESSQALDAIIRRVRAVLESAEGWRRLVSVRGVGFQLLAGPPDAGADISGSSGSIRLSDQSPPERRSVKRVDPVLGGAPAPGLAATQNRCGPGSIGRPELVPNHDRP